MGTNTTVLRKGKEIMVIVQVDYVTRQISF